MRLLTRVTAILAAFVALSLFTTTAAYAASVHLKGGAHAEPALTDLGLTLAAAGELAGLGNGDVLVTLTATGDPTATCQNPGTGEHYPPGQNPAPITLTGSVSIPEAEVKNGWTPFGVVTESPVTPVPSAVDCPNPLWVEEITDMSFTAVTLTVEQPPSVVVLTVMCVIDPASADGPVPPGDVTCT